MGKQASDQNGHLPGLEYKHNGQLYGFQYYLFFDILIIGGFAQLLRPCEAISIYLATYQL